MTQSNIDFTQTMLKEILPLVKKLIEKEESYLKGLQLRLQKTEDRKSFFNRLLYSQEEIDLLNFFIKKSNKQLAYFKQIQKEYEDYVLKNWN